MFEHINYNVCARARGGIAYIRYIIMAKAKRLFSLNLYRINFWVSFFFFCPLLRFHWLLLFFFLVANQRVDTRKFSSPWFHETAEVFKSPDDEQIERAQRNFYSILIHTKPSVKKEFALTVGICFYYYYYYSNSCV